MRESTGEKIKRTKNRQKYGRKSTTNALSCDTCNKLLIILKIDQCRLKP